MSENPVPSGPSQEPAPQESVEESVEEAERRERRERRSLIDLTRAERGEPERRHLPGLERRGPEGETPGD